MTILLLLAGLVLLILGAEALVRGASRLAAAAGITPLIVGLTVVAFGTSAPELAVSTGSALAGQAGIAVGNVVGSNIFNVLFILGLSALIVPLTVSAQLIRLDVPIMIGCSVALLGLGLDGRLSRPEGALLFGALLTYTALLINQGRRQTAAGRTADSQAGVGPARPVSWPANAALVVGGLGLLVLGSQWLVGSAVAIAQALGVSELVVGLTVVAAGTSMPEVVTSLVAAVRGERDIAVGNVVGSNVFNLLGVLGLSSLVAPAGLEVSAASLHFDLPIMVAVAFACLPIFFTGHVIARWEGALFLAYYLAYTLYLILAATQHDALAVYGTAMRYFVLPLTGLTLLVVSLQALRTGRRA